ncbi:MAG: hypothetical protein JL50_01490 [Peptococcaceae bacterium BICA1-7]|nr:MAG: hypothetical protein JL50_01490 [Peptococcaceae bacterium BICA1-7]HBV97939.1 hypothetical protein [Desulfotomaculum sp.]
MSGWVSDSEDSIHFFSILYYFCCYSAVSPSFSASPAPQVDRVHLAALVHRELKDRIKRKVTIY